MQATLSLNQRVLRNVIAAAPKPLGASAARLKKVLTIFMASPAGSILNLPSSAMVGLSVFKQMWTVHLGCKLNRKPHRSPCTDWLANAMPAWQCSSRAGNGVCVETAELHPRSFKAQRASDATPLILMRSVQQVGGSNRVVGYKSGNLRHVEQVQHSINGDRCISST